MIFAQTIRELTLAEPSQAGRPAFIAAASGIAQFKQHFYVVADDEIHLGMFGLHDLSPGQLFRLLPGELPLDSKARKKSKPDFEALVLLDSQTGGEASALLAIPSGSASNRNLGIRVPLGVDGAPQSPEPVDFTRLYQALAGELGSLNIEGATVVGHHLKLLQRGNSRQGVNAILDLDLNATRRALTSGKLGPDLVVNITRINLGSLHGIPLGFTDAAAIDDQSFLFLAAAEATDDAVLDGPCAGSVLGRMSSTGRVEWMREISPRVKAEGLMIETNSAGIEAFFVTDDDDPECASRLYCCQIKNLSQN